MKPIIGRDVFFVQRQFWIERLQRSTNDSWKDPMLWCILGILFTACLMAW